LFFLEDLGIDDEMDKILKNTSDEIDQVRLFPNGKYEPITLEGKKHFWFCMPQESFCLMRNTRRTRKPCSEWKRKKT
jgi:hypothetical protein